MNVTIRIFTTLLFLCFINSLFPQNAPITKRITLRYEENKFYKLKNLSYQIPKKLKVGLVLSGGGARGFAHIGVLKAFEENGIPIDLIVGSSMGSVVGGFYAAGFSSDELIDIMKEVDWQDIFSDETYRTNLFWSQLRFDKGIPYFPSALSPGQKIFDIIYSKLLKANFQAANNFDRLRIPFRAVATDLISGKRVVLRDGDLAEAISASIAVPLLFEPVERDGMWLADGGIRDNLPVDIALENGVDLIIAVDVTSPLRKVEQMRSPWQIADQVTTIMMQEPTRESRKLADILIQPQLGEHGAGDFSKVDTLIALGYQAAISKIDSIKNVIKLRQERLWGENQYLGVVKDVLINGLEETGLDTLKRNMATQSGYDVYLYDIYKDLYRFYNTGLISNAYALLRGKPQSYTVEFYLKENPVVSHIKFKSQGLIPDSILLQQMNFPLNTTLNYKILVKNIDALQNFYIKQGYSLARIYQTEYQDSDSSLIFYIQEGKIGKIHIAGNKTTRDGIILREFPLSEGQVFQADLAVQGIRNIYSTGLFDKVTLSVIQKEYDNDLVIRVKEKKYLLMRLGGNASLERKGRVFIEFAEDNLFGRDIKALVWGSIGELERRAEFELYSVRLFKTLLTYRISLYYDERWDRYYQDFIRRGDYLTIRRGIRFILGQQIARLGSITAQFRWDNISVHSRETPVSLGGRYRIRSIMIRSVVDKRDRLPFPERGIYNRWYWETGNQRLLKSSVAFTRFFIALEGYYPFFGNFNYHIKTMVGSSDLTLPFSEFFTLGGMQNFPGLYERERFGRQIFYLSNELRYKIRWHLPIDLYLGLNYQLGATWETSEAPIQKTDFLTSIGAYVAVNSILGPIRLVYGRLENKRNVLYFSVGYDF